MQNSIACRDIISFLSLLLTRILFNSSTSDTENLRLSLRLQLGSLNIVFPSSRLEKDEGLIIGPALSMEALREEPFT